MNAPKLVLHASLAGLYGALVIALIVMLANRDGAPQGAGSWLLTALPVVVVYTLAAGIAWPLLYGAVRFFASHPLRAPWLGLRYLMAFHVVNGAAVLAAAWFTLSASRRVLGPDAIERLAFTCLSLTLAWVFAAAVTAVPAWRRSAPLQIGAGSLALLALALLLPGGRAEPRGALGAAIEGPRSGAATATKRGR